MKLSILIFIFLASDITQADNCKRDDQAEFECCELFKSISSTKITRIQTRDKSICTMSVYNRDADHSFRRFGFGSDGQVSVFLQPGGNKEKRNSSQSFLIFPFGELPHYKYSDDKLQVLTGSGQRWTFNAQSSLPVAVEGCDIQVSSKFNLQDSGIKIRSCKKHLVVETPVEVGGEYIAYPDKLLTVRDPEGESCQIKTADLYNYKKTNYSYKDKLGRYFDVKLKFKSNRELRERLKKICPKLDLSMLNHRSESPSPTSGSSYKEKSQDVREGQTGK